MIRILSSTIVLASFLFAAETGTVAGTVRDAATGKTLSGVSIKLAGKAASTDSKGKFKVTMVPVGPQKLSASKRGYETAKLTVKVNPRGVSRISISLVPKTPKPKPKTPVESSSGSDPTKPTGKKKKDEPVSGLSKRPSGTVPADPAPTSEPETDNPSSSGGYESSSSYETGDPPPAPAAPPGARIRPGIVGKEDAGKHSTRRLEGSRTDGERRTVPSASGLKAGFADDNRQFNYFTHFLKKFEDVAAHYDYDVSERIHIRVLDEDGKSLPNVHLKVFDKKGETMLSEGLSYSDGSFFIYPAAYTHQDETYLLVMDNGSGITTREISRSGLRDLEIGRPMLREIPGKVPLDIVFILDTTGSMGEEIKRLIATIDIINLNLDALPSKPAIRFGMVLYKDKQDSYHTRVVPLTEDVAAFSRELNKITAEGGGDTPEDLQEALSDAMKRLDWNPAGLRLGFIITDAPPHLDYKQEYTYIDAALEAKQRGIKLYSVGTGGLNLNGEYVLRQISQLTYAKYIFLTYGEEGESEGGRPGSVSHHTGNNYQTDKLESIIIRIAKEELSHLTDEPLLAGEEYYEASKIEDESNEETLAKLFKQAVSRLADYATVKIEKGTPLAVLPIIAREGASTLDAEYFSEQLILSMSTSESFKLVARKDLQAVLEEQKLAESGLVDEAQTMEIGNLLGAEMLLTSEMYSRDSSYELFMKLLRTETGEILAVNKVVIDKQLGLATN